MMQDLPEDVVSFIGSFLDKKYRQNCYQACKGLKSISWAYIFESVTLSPENCKDRVNNIKNIITAIKNFKKNLKILRIYTQIDNTHVDGIVPFDADSFEGLELEVVVEWNDRPNVDRVMDLFQNVHIKYIHLFINHGSVISHDFYSKVKGDKIVVEIVAKDQMLPIDLRVVPQHINIHLNIQYDIHEIIEADKADTIYFLRNNNSIINLIEISLLTHDTLPRLKSIGYMPLFPIEFPIEKSTLFKLLNRCDSELIIFLHDTYAKEPTIIPYLRFFTKKIGLDKLVVKYDTHDTHVLATIIHRITGITIMKSESENYYQPTLELTTSPVTMTARSSRSLSTSRSTR